MLLAVDIGNSNTVFGIFKGKKIVSQFQVVTPCIGKYNLKRKIKIENIDGQDHAIVVTARIN